MDHEIRHVTDANRYELWLAGVRVGVADYERRDGVVVATHTVIDPRHRGAGLGELLAERMLTDALANGDTIEPRCWFIAEYLDQHPQFHGLRASR